MAWEDKFKINLNQNLWGLVVAYAALGAAEYWQLEWLKWLTGVVAAGISFSVLICLVFYTWHYCVRKCAQAREIKSRMSARASARSAKTIAE